MPLISKRTKKPKLKKNKPKIKKFNKKEYLKNLKFINLILQISKKKKTQKLHKEYLNKLRDLMKY